MTTRSLMTVVARVPSDVSKTLKAILKKKSSYNIGDIRTLQGYIYSTELTDWTQFMTV